MAQLNKRTEKAIRAVLDELKKGATFHYQVEFVRKDVRITLATLPCEIEVGVDLPPIPVCSFTLGSLIKKRYPRRKK